MKLRELLLAITFIAFALVLPACGVGSASTGTTGFGGYSPGAPVTLAVSPIPTSIPVNSIVNFTATTSSTQPATWTLVNASVAAVGTFTYPNGSDTAQYTAPSTPPIYPTGVTSTNQGNIVLDVEAFNSSGTATLEQYTIPITAPSIAAGITPATASVALGASQYFSGYAVGGVGNGIVFTVNGIVNGNAAVGTINASGDYVAPATMPMSGPTITIVCTSAADPTKSATAIVTLH